MYAKIFMAWTFIFICLSMQAQSQYDPLGIDALMRPLDPEHTTEYLDQISSRTYLGPIVPASEDLRGNWNLNLQGGMPGIVDLLLVQNRDAVFGRGTMYFAGSANAISASGQAIEDVLNLDLVNGNQMTLYRCTLTISRGFLSGSFIALDAYGHAWSGTIQGSRSA
jgi:hypothetical protein